MSPLDDRSARPTKGAPNASHPETFRISRRRIGPLALVLVAVSFACSGSSQEGIVVTLQAEAAKVPAASTFDTDLGYRVVLGKAYVNLSSVEIFGCDASSASFPDRAGRVLGELFALERSAYAHTEGSPTKLGAPLVESVFTTSGGVTVGELRPPPGRYCRVVQSLQAADADARGLPSDVSMVGKSFFVAGTYEKNGAIPVPFESESTASFDAATDLSFELSTTGTTSVTVRLSRDATHWFDGIDFATMGKRDIATRIVDSMAKSYGARTE